MSTIRVFVTGGAPGEQLNVAHAIARALHPYQVPARVFRTFPDLLSNRGAPFSIKTKVEIIPERMRNRPSGELQLPPSFQRTAEETYSKMFSTQVPLERQTVLDGIAYFRRVTNQNIYARCGGNGNRAARRALKILRARDNCIVGDMQYAAARLGWTYPEIWELNSKTN